MTTLPPAIGANAPTAALPASSAKARRLGLRRDNQRWGIQLLIASTAVFSLSDSMSKHLASTLPAIEVAWLRYLVFCLLALPAGALMQRNRNPLATGRPGLQVARGLAMAASAILFTLALKALPLADATAISFVAPIFIMALSTKVLGERVGAQGWIAALVGLIGVMIIIRPGSSMFTPAALLPLTSALAWAATIVVTRKMSETEEPVTTLAWSAVVGFAVLSTLLPFHWVTPQLEQIGLGLLIGVTATTGQLLMIKAYANADASSLAPFTYGQLIWACILGFVIFGGIPGPWTFIGAAVIVASGLYIGRAGRDASG